MVEMHCWETYLVHSWKKYNIQIIAGWKICTDHSPGWKRTKLIPGNLLIRRPCWKVGTSIFFIASLEIELIIFPGDF